MSSKLAKVIKVSVAKGTKVKVGLHYGDNRSKLVYFEYGKIFSMFKKALALRDLRHSVNTTYEK